MLDTLIAVLVFGGFLVTGFIGTFWPALIHSLDTENASAGPPSPQQLRTMRVSSLVMFLMGCIGIYAVLTWDGTPPDGPLF
jgi:hypothetical protein